MPDKTSYQQLQPEERLAIASLRLQDVSIRAMARMLGRSPSTVSRELTRNSSPAGYASVPAEALSAARRSAGRRPAKLCLQSVCWRVVLTLLEWKWSPQQISGTLKRMYPTDPTQHVSHETIYTAIYAQPRGELRRQLIACLRHGHSTRMSRTRGTDRRGQIPEMVSIHVRPPEIEDRLLPGHWEGDFIKGAGNQSSVGVLVERTSRLVLLAKMEDATAASALPDDHLVVYASPAETPPFVTFISTTTQSVVSKLVFNGSSGLEACTYHSYAIHERRPSE
jgi:IS30 family transposase